MPRAIPATLEGLQLTKKAARTGFDWDDAAGIFDKMRGRNRARLRTL